MSHAVALRVYKQSFAIPFQTHLHCVKTTMPIQSQYSKTFDNVIMMLAELSFKLHIVFCIFLLDLHIIDAGRARVHLGSIKLWGGPITGVICFVGLSQLRLYLAPPS